MPTYTHNYLPLSLSASCSLCLSLSLPVSSTHIASFPPLLRMQLCCAVCRKRQVQSKRKKKMRKFNRLIRGIELAIQAGLLLRLSNLIPKIFQADCKAAKVFVAGDLGLEGAGCPFAKNHAPKNSVPGVLRPLRCGTRSRAA